jgi:hypothetical protein
MVAITVILAAVIGAFVLEIGDQQETAPSTSFDSEEQVINYGNTGSSGNTKRQLNVTQVEFSHAGGDVLDVAQFEVVVNGNSSVWGIQCFDCAARGANDQNLEQAEPAPDFRPALGSNEQVDFKSGQTMDVVAYEGPNDEYVPNERYRFWAFDPPGSERPQVDQIPKSGLGVPATQLMSDDRVNVVWTASSGGKTQTLFKYSVQQNSPDF